MSNDFQIKYKNNTINVPGFALYDMATRTKFDCQNRLQQYKQSAIRLDEEFLLKFCDELLEFIRKCRSGYENI